MSEPVIPERREIGLPAGTFDCPICGTDYPHDHTGEEIAIYSGARSPALELKALTAAIGAVESLANHYIDKGLDGRKEYPLYAVVLRAIKNRIESAAEAKVAEQAATIADLKRHKQEMQAGAEGLLEQLSQQAATIKRLTGIATTHPVFSAICAHDEEPWYCDSCQKLYQDELLKWCSLRDAALSK